MAKANFPLKKRIELVEQCFEFVKTGQPVGRFADSIGIPRTTLYGWLRRYSKMAARDRNTDSRMVPVTRHSSPLPAIVPFRNELPSPETEKETSGKAISIDLGYCRVDIPQGCGSDAIAMLIKGIRDSL